MEFYLTECVEVAGDLFYVGFGFVEADVVASAAEVPFQNEFFGQQIPVDVVGGIVFRDERDEDVVKSAVLDVFADLEFVGALFDKGVVFVII